MVINLEIHDDRIANMSLGAKETMQEKLKEYVDNVIKEANLIEEGNRETGARGEITSSIILQSTQKNNRIIKKKIPIYVFISRIVSPLSILLTGFLFDQNGYKDNTIKMIFFIVTLILACVTTVLQYVKEM